MGRSPCCDENGLKKGPWTPEEDQKLVDFIQNHGHGSWRALPKLAGLNRCGKSCRLRWTNYLRPNIKRGKFSPEEEQTILNLHSILGNKWSAIATRLPGRTDNEIKNFWNTHLKKKLIQMGFDPMTHRPRTDVFAALPGLLALANLYDLVDRRPWDDHSMNLQYLQYMIQSAAQCSPNPNINKDNDNNHLHGLNHNIPNSHQDFDSMGLLNQTSFVQDVDGLMHSELQMMPRSYDQQQQPLSTDTNHGSCFNTLLSPRTPLMEGLDLPLLADVSGPGTGGDACSTSSCGGTNEGISSFWPDLLLDDPFMNEFA